MAKASTNINLTSQTRFNFTLVHANLSYLLLVSNFNSRDYHVFKWLVVAVLGYLGNFVNDIHAFSYMAKNSVSVVKPWRTTLLVSLDNFFWILGIAQLLNKALWHVLVLHDEEL